ncbi:unnamed protein product [marine sediment metagenome]|uniref:DUF4198 domain-containing protein n=1 Tax=marine sediment metagenome TaxID=412755 RepID=X1VDE1_9ZZZZ
MKNLKFRTVLFLCLVVMFSLSLTSAVSAHFGMVIPSDDMVSKDDSKKITLKVQFIHPMEGDYMDMAKPSSIKIFLS